MLANLKIQNYALIEHLDINFENGFSVITGETGAGKSILLGAIGLLLGQRADTKSIKNGANRCTIEAEFHLKDYAIQSFFENNEFDYDGESCLIRREIQTTGKSRSFINDTPASVTQLRELGEKLIDIHSQHQNLLLCKENFLIQVLDIVAQDASILHEYQQRYKDYRTLQQQLEEAIQTQKNARTEQDYLQFQYNQLEEANLKEGEQEALEEELHTLEHAEEIKENLYQTHGLLANDHSGIVNGLREAVRMLRSLVDVYPKTEDLCDRINSCYIETKDIAEEIENSMDNIEYDPERQILVNERLNLIYDLQQKHHVETIQELLGIKDSIGKKLETIENSDEQIAILKEETNKKEQELTESAQALSTARQQAAQQVEQEMCQRLIPLGMPNIRFQVAISSTKEFEATGTDSVQFYFSANKNSQLQPIAQVASGGEIARVMLALKALMSRVSHLPTIIFDEIDTGVSGHIAESMAKMMQEMGKEGNHQVISITHLPQIAAMGKQHYRVYKDDDEQGTTSHIVQLTDEERIEEIAHMLSGATITQTAIDNAKSLLTAQK